MQKRPPSHGTAVDAFTSAQALIISKLETTELFATNGLRKASNRQVADLDGRPYNKEKRACI